MPVWLRTAALVVVLAGCAHEAERFADAADLAAALTSAEVACAALQPAPAAELVDDQASCMSTEGVLGLYVFAGTEQREDWLQVAAQLGPVAVGPNWAVSGGRADIEQAAEALNGQLPNEK